MFFVGEDEKKALFTKLTGRYLEFELFPLTFEEYLQMKIGKLFLCAGRVYDYVE